MRVKLVIASALLLLATPFATGAATSLDGQLHASGLSVEGDGSMNSTLAGAAGEWSALDEVLPDATFQLAAANLRVKTFYADPKINANPVGLSLEGEVAEDSYRDARLVGKEVRPEFKWALFPTNGASMSVSSSCVEIVPSDADRLERESNVVKSDEEDYVVTADVSNTLRAHLCGNGTMLRATGDFLLTLWEWDATLETQGEVIDLRSGHHQSQNDPVGNSATRSLVNDARHQYLYVTDGDLQFPANDASQAYLRDATLDAQGSFEFRDAVGEMDVSAARRVIDAQLLRLLGNLSVSVSASEGILLGSVMGTIDSADADGQLLAWTVKPAASYPDSSWIWGLLGGLVLAAALGWRLSRSARLGWHTRRAVAAIDAKRFRAAIRHCNAVVRMHREHAEARIMRAFAYTCLDRNDAALNDHAAAHAILIKEGGGQLGAQNAIEAAMTSLEKGDKTEARRWLEIATQCDAAAAYALLTADHREALRPFMVNVRASNDAYA